MVRDKFPSVIIIENTDNKGFSKANNQGVAIAKGEYILFLNPDTVMPEDFFHKTISYMDEHPEAGSIGPRLIDGKGIFAPDGKKSFPTLSVAVFKTTGVNKLFKNSPYFNKYYAVHIKERQLAEVDVLSGCCMMVRRSVIDKIGGAFDEDYFMYCEDVDLSYRIQKAGYKNIYFPEVDLIHYKGESTRKATMSYVRTFNEALLLFVKKNYGKKDAKLFLLFINIGIVLRVILSLLKRVLKVLRMPLFDALILFATLWLIKEFWVIHVKGMQPIPLSSIYATFPVYIALWVLSLYFNGAYDQPYRAWRVVRGMLAGTVVILAYYGLLQPGLRYSRAIIIFTGFSGAVVMLGLHELLYRLGIFKFIPYDKLPRKAVIVAGERAYQDTSAILQRIHYAPELAGRIAPAPGTEHALANLPDMKQLLYTAGINEVIFCINGLSYTDVFEQMQNCGSGYDYKIHLPGSMSFVGSNSSNTAGDLYTIDRRYNLANFAQLRNKRIIDIVFAFSFIILSPILIFTVKNPGMFFANCFRVLSGSKTWIGYASVEIPHAHLPKLREGIAPPYFILGQYEPADEVKSQLNTVYAQQYTPGMDMNLIIKNLRYLGQ
jgi:GT2 family glycosyltransferase